MTGLANACCMAGDDQRARDLLRRALVLNHDMLVSDPILLGVIGIAILLQHQGHPAITLDMLAAVLHYPQCSSVGRIEAEHTLALWRAHFSAQEVDAVMDKARRGQLATAYLNSDFSIDRALIDRLLLALAVRKSRNRRKLFHARNRPPKKSNGGRMVSVDPQPVRARRLSVSCTADIIDPPAARLLTLRDAALGIEAEAQADDLPAIGGEVDHPLAPFGHVAALLVERLPRLPAVETDVHRRQIAGRQAHPLPEAQLGRLGGASGR